MKLEPKLREKRWNGRIEKQLRKLWEKEGLYKFNPRTAKQVFAIDTPPPYPRLN